MLRDMEQRPFGPTGVMVPVIGQGTWAMERDRKGSIAALRRGLDLGMTHIDTAEMYGRGAVEEIVGEAILGRREEVFLVSKVLPANASARGTVEACERSLRHLRADHLDVYLLHAPSSHPFEETLQGFRHLLEEGKIRAYGVSNFDEGRLEEAVSLARPESIACNQVPYHLKERHIELGLIDAGLALGVAVVGYSPFGQGDFPERHPVLVEIASAHHATPRQVALRFLLRRPGTFTIPKASSVAHAEENAGAGDLRLQPEEIDRIDAAFPLRAARSGLPGL
jgi:diketogulonate reductase-like aldo/keto reductase